MKLEVLLSVLNLDKKLLSKMNITSKCSVINQCGKNGFSMYKNFNIYLSDDIGTANSRNLGLSKVSEDIIILCDDDVVYNKDYEKIILNEFKNNKSADVIMFNFDNPYRKKRINQKTKRLHFYNVQNYASYNIAFRRESVLNKNIKFNTLFGPGAKYKSGGDDSLFINSCLKNKLKIYSSDKFIGKIVSDESTWFQGYNEKYFFDKGALFTAINNRFRHILMLQYLIRHRDVLTNYKLIEAYKIMLKGSKEYRKEINKKVLEIVYSNSYSGVFKLVYDISKNINKMDVDILTQTSIYKDKNIYDLGIKRKSIWSRFVYNHRLYKFLKKNKYGIVHIHSGIFLYSLQLVLISRLTGVKKVIVHSHSVAKMNKIRLFLKTILNPLYRSLCVGYLSCSKKASYSLFAKSFINKDKITIVNNGIELDKFKFNEKIRNEYRKKLNIEDKIVYGHSGRFSSEKNHEFLIDLFYEIQKIQSNSILLLVGEGELLDGIKSKVNKLGISDKVFFLGFRSDVNKILNAMDVFLFPSKSEGLGLSVIESQANGLTTYSANTIPSEANITPYFKYFDLNDNIEIIAKEIVKGKVNTKRKDSYKYVEESHYDIKEVSKKLENIYLSL